MKKILSFVFIIFFHVFYAQVVQRPMPPHLYNNLSTQFPGFLNASEAAQLEEKLEVFSNETSNQICVVVLDDLNGDEASQYAVKIGTDWGVGKKGANNGIVILIKPTTTGGGRDLFIAVGYGLEGAIPDLATSRIREQEMLPYLKNGENFTALDKGTDVLMKLAKGEIDVKDYTRSQNRHGRGRNTSTIVIIILVILFIILRNFFGGGGGRTFSRTGSTIFWGSMMGGNFGGGGGSSSGGGWGGFGGGGFGGGGSGGKW